MDGFFVGVAAWCRAFLTGLGFAPAAVETALAVGQGAAILAFLLLNVTFLVLMERKVSAFIQQRLGPNRMGPHGLLQTVMDVMKLFGKENIVPTCVDRPMFMLAPVLVMVPTTLLFVVLPFGRGMTAAELDIGLFYYLAISSISVVVLLMAGWGSNNKYSLLGGMRAVAQMISYEIPLVFSLMGVVLLSGTLNLGKIVAAQSEVWFVAVQPVAFCLFFLAAIAELNRGPFDLPEGEQELTGGCYTEYSGMGFAFFFLAEYANMLAMAMLIVTVFLGGWHGPWLPSWLWMLLKVYGVIWVMMWIRWTLPRVRVDKLMAICWKFALPLAVGNLLLTGAVVKLLQWL